MSVKLCKKCGVNQPLTEFGPDKKSRDRLTYVRLWRKPWR